MTPVVVVVAGGSVIVVVGGSVVGGGSWTTGGGTPVVVGVVEPPPPVSVGRPTEVDVLGCEPPGPAVNGDVRTLDGGAPVLWFGAVVRVVST